MANVAKNVSSTPPNADAQAIEQAVASNENGQYTEALALLRNAQSTTPSLFEYTEVDRKLDQLNSTDPRNRGGLNTQERQARAAEIDACSKNASCDTAEIEKRYDRIASDRAEATLTVYSAIQNYENCAGEVNCVGGSLAQLKAVATDLKAKGEQIDQGDVIALNITITSAAATLRADSEGSLADALTGVWIGSAGGGKWRIGTRPKRNGANGGVTATGKLIGSTKGLTTAAQSFIGEMGSGGKTVQVIPATNAERTADFFIDGTKVELKTMSKVVNQTADGLSKSLSSTIMSARGQLGNIIIDARGQVGMTPEIAELGIGRAFGNDSQSGSKIQGVTVITSQGTVYIPRKP